MTRDIAFEQFHNDQEHWLDDYALEPLGDDWNSTDGEGSGG
jgi:hypothetical protein